MPRLARTFPSQFKSKTPKRVEIDGKPVMLYREGCKVYAIGAVCSHAGGPLDEGKFENGCVTCPWHDSVFDMRDGHIVHGSATFPQPRFAARLHNGQVEIRVVEG
ncbi:MAG TPA: Rieske (2Fe-2S) protein [Tepidisphaeraceae bacterium]|nr:Rieske (2Fe-2S) protein [Tepidisphaeraceae bacterium]